MMQSFRDDMAQGYRCAFTSGASEANCTALVSICDAVREARGDCSLLISAYEHKSILMCAEDMAKRSLVHLHTLNPNGDGVITPESVERMLMLHRCDVVAVMHANNELGVMNDVEAIAQIAHKYGAVMHSDVVQVWGKGHTYKHVDSMAISWHKLHGPPGTGAWLVRDALYKGFQLHPLIYGTQNDNMRGGTENLPGIAAAYSGWKHTMTDRASKNAKLTAMQNAIVDHLHGIDYSQWHEDMVVTAPTCVLFGTRAQRVPGFVFFSVVLPRGHACNGKIKKALEKQGIIVSIGSACNTASKYASHVLHAMGAGPRIRSGAIRVTLGDNNTWQDVKQFIDAIDVIMASNITKD